MGMRARCWMTGVEIQRGDAWVLDRARAASIRQELAGRLAVLDKFLEEYGVVAGTSDRAAELGAKPWFRRAVSGFVAKGYGGMFGDETLFVLQTDDQARSLERKRSMASRHPWLGDRFREMSEDEFARVRHRSHVARGPLNTQDQLRMRRIGLDLALAEVGPGDTPGALASWMATTALETILEAVSPPGNLVGVCHDLLQAWGVGGADRVRQRKERWEGNASERPMPDSGMVAAGGSGGDGPDAGEDEPEVNRVDPTEAIAWIDPFAAVASHALRSEGDGPIVEALVSPEAEAMAPTFLEVGGDI